MANQKGKGKGKRKAAAKNGAEEIAIRMYNVGFGDAFLVAVPNGGQTPLKILFDCGSIEAATGVSMGDIVKIVADATDADGVARIDVVVGTHRHKDHVSGFSSKAWQDVEVKEVWMPWTEDPADEESRRIRDIQSRLALALDASLRAKLAAGPQPELERPKLMVDNALSLTNEAAMKTLHGGFAGQALRRFLPIKKGPQKCTFTSDALPGVKAHVMGPSRERDIIRDMDPPAGKSYLRLAGPAVLANGGFPPPFPGEAHLPTPPSEATFDLAKDAEAIQRAAAVTDLAVAVALDKAVNGTSLMLMLEVAGTHLLFPGDAQWGTWEAAMKDPLWRELLTKVAFYKIGHHGSHNATPKDFVETMLPDRCWAMASMKTRDIWPDIPKDGLITALSGKNVKLARSDQEKKLSQGFKAVGPGVIEARIPL